MRFDTRTEAAARAAKRRGSVLVGVAQNQSPRSAAEVGSPASARCASVAMRCCDCS
jgi:hypothetical protein